MRAPDWILLCLWVHTYAQNQEVVGFMYLLLDEMCALTVLTPPCMTVHVKKQVCAYR